MRLTYFRALARNARALTLDHRTARTRRELTHRWATPNAARRHQLRAPLIVSLTSYPARFTTLALTLRCLLRQTLQPDTVQLWIAADAANQLPEDVLALRRFGLEIIPTKDLRSYKKIIPALCVDPERFIAIADDDAHYPANWLETLVTGLDLEKKIIPCGRAHRVRQTSSGVAAPYERWSRCIRGGSASTDIFATGVGGVLYPPGSLDALTTDEACFLQLAADCDDAWLYWMARRSGWRFRKVGRSRHVTCWPGSQETGLQHANATASGNDAAIERLTRAFGRAWRADFTVAPASQAAKVRFAKLARAATGESG